MLRETEQFTDSPYCRELFSSEDVGEHKNLFIVGSPFLRSYVSVYDIEKARVGLVRSVHSNEKVELKKKTNFLQRGLLRA